MKAMNDLKQRLIDAGWSETERYWWRHLHHQ